MAVRIGELFVEGKSPGYCEDVVTVTSDFVAVIDGVTSLSGVDEPGSGRAAAVALAGAVQMLPAHADVREALGWLAGALSVGAAVLAVYSRHRHEIWRVGDVHVMVDGRVLPRIGADRDDAAARMRADRMRALLAAGMDPAEASGLARAEITPVLLETRRRANLDYGVLLPGVVPPSEVVEVFPAGRVNVLCSDGYVEPLPVLAQAEALVRHVVNIDPWRCFDYPGTKGVPAGGTSFDDRAYVSVIADR